MHGSLHIVQVGFDDTLFVADAPSDTMNRQLEYGRELERQRPGSRMTVVALTTLASARRYERENVVILPVIASRLTRLPALYFQLSMLHREWPLDVISPQTVHLEALAALLFGMVHGVNVVGQIHYDLFSPIAQQEVLGGGVRGRLHMALTRWMLPRMVAVRVVGQGVQRQLLATGLHNHVSVIPVPVTMNPSTAGADLAPVVAHKVLFVGWLVAAKNIREWLLVAQRVAAVDENVSFEIVGEGPLRAELQREVERLGLDGRVYFRGAVAYTQLPQVYRSAKVFLLTSKHEGFGRVVVEAYLHQVPTVATRVTGIEDIVDDGQTGFLHPPGDVAGLTDSVLRLLHNDSLREEMGQRGNVLVRARFDPERLSSQWINLLVSSAEERRP